MHPYIIYIYVVLWFIMSLVTFILYKTDKVKAEKNKRRISEKTLLLSSFLLGSMGGLLGMYLVRHKTKHWYFVLVNWASFVLHVVILNLLLPDFSAFLS
ncbi:DUF1294 domain-containing protein [Acholeplasma equirhinis]|uniref:DUF1294 domain-containing protein n=1 Tax=Acholeplasma equirhinis TaxID=555393 RepID=UPI00197AF86C|nr:DUF1294 domain-containing protein [Acholeplasma equirhinis]MBN3490267.1 DUF1294 domain-containing protein [Acholeplasma equirhinis]